MNWRGRKVSSEAGFTIIEVMVAAVIMTVALLPLVGIINRGVILSQQAQERTIAMGLAVDYLESIKAYLPHQPSDFTPSVTRADPPAVLGDIVYTSQENAQRVTKNTQKNRQKDFYRYVTVNGTETNPLGQSFTTNGGNYTYHSMVATITVFWYDGVSGTEKKISLSNELVGR